MPLSSKPWWIKERCNPQTGVYYVACGQLPVREAKRAAATIYGNNYMLRFDTVGAYMAKAGRVARGRRSREGGRRCRERLSRTSSGLCSMFLSAADEAAKRTAWAAVHDWPAPYPLTVRVMAMGLAYVPHDRILKEGKT